MVNPFVTVGAFAKVAEDPLSGPGSQAWENSVVVPKARSNIGNMLMMGLGTGAAARGVLGLLQLARRRVDPPTLGYPGAVVTSMPYPVRKKEEEEQAKLASYAMTPNQKPWYLPGMVAAGGLGALGGWAGLDALMQSRRKSELEEDTDQAKGQFERALLDSYDRPRAMGVKVASADIGGQLGDALDQLYDQMGKQGADWNNLFNQGLGMYGAYAVPAAALTGYLGYKNEREAAPGNILEKAMRRRAQRAYAASPSEILAIPRPVEVRSGASPEEQEEELARSQHESSEQSSHPFPA